MKHEQCIRIVLVICEIIRAPVSYLDAQVLFKIIDRELLHGLKSHFKSVIITRLLPQTARIGDEFSGTVTESMFVYDCQTFIERHLPERRNN